MSESSRTVYTLRITLNGSKPPIWRRVAVPSDIVLGELHDVIQIAMGWTDSHLHQFILRNKARKPSPRSMADVAQQDALLDAFLGRIAGTAIASILAVATVWPGPLMHALDRWRTFLRPSEAPDASSRSRGIQPS